MCALVAFVQGDEITLLRTMLDLACTGAELEQTLLKLTSAGKHTQRVRATVAFVQCHQIRLLSAEPDLAFTGAQLAQVFHDLARAHDH